MQRIALYLFPICFLGHAIYGASDPHPGVQSFSYSHLPRPYLHCISFVAAAAELFPPDALMAKSSIQNAGQDFANFAAFLSRRFPHAIPRASRRKMLGVSSFNAHPEDVANVRARLNVSIADFDRLRGFGYLGGRAQSGEFPRNFEALKDGHLGAGLLARNNPAALQQLGGPTLMSIFGWGVFAKVLWESVTGTPPFEWNPAAAPLIALMVSPVYGYSADHEFPERNDQLKSFLNSKPDRFAWYYETYEARISKTLIRETLRTAPRTPIPGSPFDAATRRLLSRRRASDDHVREQNSESLLAVWLLKKVWHRLLGSDQRVTVERLLSYDPLALETHRWSHSLRIRLDFDERPRIPRDLRAERDERILALPRPQGLVPGM